jgi:hypothetical protein
MVAYLILLCHQDVTLSSSLVIASATCSYSSSYRCFLYRLKYVADKVWHILYVAKFMRNIGYVVMVWYIKCVWIPQYAIKGSHTFMLWRHKNVCLFVLSQEQSVPLQIFGVADLLCVLLTYLVVHFYVHVYVDNGLWNRNSVIYFAIFRSRS